MRFGAPFLAAILALAQPAGAIELFWPVACQLGETCHIQQFVDHDPGPIAQDYTCGALSYDGHDGTDIALPNRAAMETGFQVLAAAPGTVLALRDGIPDFAPVIPGKECGNGVVINHGAGWVTQYCHLRLGSISVKTGQPIASGQPLGLVGQSGQAEFPHLHLSVRHNDTVIDPFAPEAAACGTPPATDLWQATAPYQPGGLLAAGFGPAVPEWDEIRAGLPTQALPADAPGLVLWAHLFGAREGDRLGVTITGPEGTLLDETMPIDRTQAQSFRALGKKRPEGGWPPGDYAGQIRLMRDGKEVDAMTTRVSVQP